MIELIKSQVPVYLYIVSLQETLEVKTEFAGVIERHKSKGVDMWADT